MMKNALILHGWPEHRVDKYFLTEHLRKQGYRVLTPDMFVRGYVFDPKNVVGKVKELLEGQGLDFAVGISLGGLVLPHVALEYPEAKLLFMSTGPYLKADSPFFNFILGLFRNTWILKIMSWVLKLPIPVLAVFYRLGSSFNGTKEEIEEYNRDMEHNINLVREIPVEEEAEIVRFIHGADNTELLKKIKNRTIIFNGEKDLFMPAERGLLLHRLLVNSELVINDGEHFNVFGEKDLPRVDQFLGLA
ncbi:MAG: hypothetical protein UX80_C0030G0007 [Candidatus Amesbacteria bacterium GW2011_GWA2_47_11b]|uniref:AB hydrolase-1 domain-containing protein n=3 Tax=Candidatus Amesiibacteriota TaxID=1752730 RepID=A0A0G1SG73_9BACT|nr:MAG: hypothetical protein UX42_C0025G0010 [Microgenomates group bacterium GW2011_GWC1_46_20]KKU56942.1 MAG: hypothetical protein UX80_C0030G0007 [Candidatus Amesbacteria bacterium GW2011_GWA2_47_11b]KKU68439.1 MAG: hypothetical protein UX92_C0020G0007 [Candidatus Amesbacteria bacterium GW2011_GWA1_47_20]